MAWTGFSDDQLRKLKFQSLESEEKGSNHVIAQGARRGRPNVAQQKKPAKTKPVTKDSNEVIRPDQMLSQPIQQTPQSRITGSKTETGQPSQTEKLSIAAKEDLESSSKEPRVPPTKEMNPQVIDEEIGRSREMTHLEELQLKQRQMEEENKRKKDMLTQAIAERKKRTQAESNKLKYIQKELGVIENLLTNDVFILRNRIDDAARDYHEAQKRYEKAEAEFVAAKINLHKKTEAKEALTEHLCAIIEQNEGRKSQKLAELINKLDAGSGGLPEESVNPPSKAIIAPSPDTRGGVKVQEKLPPIQNDTQATAPVSNPIKLGSGVNTSGSDAVASTELSLENSNAEEETQEAKKT